MIDAPGPWGTGPFTLVEGHSSIETVCAIQRVDPFTCTWLIAGEDRSDRLVLEAYPEHWNAERGPHVQRVVFLNDLSPEEALDRCVSGEGEVDIVTEVSPAHAERVQRSDYARLVAFDANRVLAGIINRFPRDVDFGDRRLREALNLAVDRQRLIREGFNGYANPLAAMTPHWCAGHPGDREPRPRDPARARELLQAGGWPQGRSLVMAAPTPLHPLALVLAQDVEEALGIGVDVVEVANEHLLAGARILVEKKIVPPWDVLLHAWFDLSSEAPPAAVHREFFGFDGAFRAGPEVPEFDRLFEKMVGELDGERFAAIAADIDRLCFDESLAVFLCAPQSLTAVNRHVRFRAYRTTFELAETEVDAEHWSRRS